MSNLCDQFLLGRDLLVAPIYRRIRSTGRSICRKANGSITDGDAVYRRTASDGSCSAGYNAAIRSGGAIIRMSR